MTTHFYLSIAFMTTIVISCNESTATINRLTDITPYEGYAILIGVNDTDVTHFGNDKSFCGAENNVTGIYSLLNKTRFKRKNIFRLHNDSTKWDTVLAILQKTQSLMDQSKNNYLFVYFSGHGSLLDVSNPLTGECHELKSPQVKTKRAQFLCFADRMVLKSEVLKQLALFDKKTKIYFLIDACHSGSNLQIASSEFETAHMSKKHPAYPDYSPAYILKKYYCSIYRKVITENIDYKYDGKSDLCVTAAASGLTTTSPGPGCYQSEFTAAYCSKWGENKPGNYKSFGNTEFYNNSTFFLNTYPLIF